MQKATSVPANITTRETCRVCRSPKISPLYSLGDLYISDFVKKDEKGIKAPLDMVMCENCSLIQLKHTAPQELLYTRFYWYRSGVTDTMIAALRDITQKIETLLELKSGDVALDIGSNDGTLLRTYEVPGLVTAGVEPATNLAEQGRKGLSHFINDFWRIESYMSGVGKGQRPWEESMGAPCGPWGPTTGSESLDSRIGW